MMRFERTRRQTLRAALAGAMALGAAGLIAPVGVPAAASAKDPSSIACPPAPQHWGNPPVTKGVTAPETTNNGYAGGYEQVAAGGNVATVACSYHSSGARQVYVGVSFALPRDLNPFNDFDLGCSKGDVSWNSTDRIYSVASHDQWALATLNDQAGYLRVDEVGAFENVTRKLLRNAKGYGHSCVLVTRPTEVPARFFFDIRAGGDNIKATFWTPPAPSRSGVFPITKFTPATASLLVNTAGGTRLLAIKLTKGIDYRLRSASASARVRFRIVVEGSKIPSCHKGAAGTLTISPPIDVAVAVCDQTFSPTVTSFIRIYTS